MPSPRPLTSYTGIPSANNRNPKSKSNALAYSWVDSVDQERGVQTPSKIFQLRLAPCWAHHHDGYRCGCARSLSPRET